MTVQEYNDCVTKYADNVYRFILKNIKNKYDAEDIVQSAFERMWEVRDQVNNEKSKSFLFTIAYRRMIDLIRKNAKMEYKESVGDGQLTATIYVGLKKTLNDALAQLTDIKKAVVLLKDYEGYSYEEIGQITGLSASQVKVYIHRARVELKNYIVKLENVL